MSIQEIIKKVRSGVCKLEFFNNGQLVNSGSGFVYKEKLVTNSHVFHPDGHIFPDDTDLKIIFGDNRNFETTMKDMILIASSPEENADFAVYSLDSLLEESGERFNFEMTDISLVNEGDEVMVLGFPFEAPYLTSHVGRISALFADGDIKKIQVDASINQGNSGGPLIHLATEKVIGVVTRKQTGLARDFDDLLRSFSNNITELEKARAGGSIKMMGIDPIDFFQVTQRQMQVVSKNIKRSANTGIGYAFSCDVLINENL